MNNIFNRRRALSQRKSVPLPVSNEDGVNLNIGDLVPRCA